MKNIMAFLLFFAEIFATYFYKKNSHILIYKIQLFTLILPQQPFLPSAW